MAISLVRWSLIFYAKVLFFCSNVTDEEAFLPLRTAISAALLATSTFNLYRCDTDWWHTEEESGSMMPSSQHQHFTCSFTHKHRLCPIVSRQFCFVTRTALSFSLIVVTCWWLTLSLSLSFSLLHYCLGSDPFFSKQPFSNPRQHTFVHRLHFFISVSPHCALFGYLSWPVRPNRSCDHRRYCAVVFG